MVDAVRTQPHQETPRVRDVLLGAAATFMVDPENRQKVSNLARFAGEVTGLGPRLEAVLRTSRDRVEQGLVETSQRGGRSLSKMQRRNLSTAVRTDAVVAIGHIRRGETQAAQRALTGLLGTIRRIPSLGDAQSAEIQSRIADIERQLGSIGDRAGSKALALEILEGDLGELFFNEDRAADYVSILERIGGRHES